MVLLSQFSYHIIGYPGKDRGDQFLRAYPVSPFLCTAEHLRQAVKAVPEAYDDTIIEKSFSLK